MTPNEVPVQTVGELIKLLERKGTKLFVFAKWSGGHSISVAADRNEFLAFLKDRVRHCMSTPETPTNAIRAGKNVYIG